MLPSMRSKFSYHNPTPRALERAFEDMDQEYPFDWYVADEHTNSFYSGCEAVVNSGMMAIAPGSNILEQSEAGWHLAIGTANQMSEFLGNLLAKLVEQNFPAGLRQSVTYVEGAPGPRTALSFYFEDLMVPTK